MPQYELNLRDYWRIIKKKKIIVIITMIMLGIFSLMFAIMNKPTPLYQATSSLKIERQMDLTGLYLSYISWGQGDDLATRSEVIKSYPMIEKAAQAMGQIDSALSPEEIRSNPKYFDIVSKLKSLVKTEQEGYTNIINIITTSDNPKEACDLANILARVYSEESFQEKNAQTIQALNAIRVQLEKAEASLRESEKNVQMYREQHRFITLDGSANRLTSQLDATESKLEKIRADINQVDNILNEINRNPDYIYFSSFSLLLNQPNRALENLQATLNQQRSTLNNYLQYYTPEHPIIIDLKRQIQTAEKQFIQELKSFRETLARSEIVTEDNYKKIEQEYKSLPLLGLTLSNLERELQIKTQMYQVLETRYQEALVKRSEQVQEVLIIRPAFVPTSPTNPTMIGPTTAIGLIIGLILGIVLAFVAETLDTTFGTVDDIEKSLGTTVLGIIPYVDIKDIKAKLMEKATTPVPDEILEMQARLVSHYNPTSTMAESFRGLRTNVHFRLQDKGYKSIMITSSVSGEGKTIIAVNLAVSLAQLGLNTLLVESDLRKPRISKLFGIDKEPGLTDVILRKEPLDSVIRTMSDLMLGTIAADTFRTENITGIEYLNILTCGKMERNPSEIIASNLMDDVISELKKRYDVIIFDSSPIIQATDATVLGSKMDTVVICYYQGKISRGTLRRSKNQLEMLKSDILGVVINGMKAGVSADYADYRYRYDYHYSYGESGEKVKKGKVHSFLETFFLREPEGLEASFFKRLKKLNVLATIAGISSVFVLSWFLINTLKPTKEAPSKPYPSEVSSLIKQEPTKTIITPVDTIEIVPVPSKLKDLQEHYGIESLTVVEPQTATIVSRIPSLKTSTQSSEVKYWRNKPQIIEISQPFTVLLKAETRLKDAQSMVDHYSRKGIKTFLAVTYPKPETERYMICTGRYPTEALAKQRLSQLFSGQNIKTEVIRLDYSILIEKFPTFQEAKQKISKYTNLKYFSWIISEPDEMTGAKQYLLLISGFRTEEIADLFIVTRPDLLPH